MSDGAVLAPARRIRGKTADPQVFHPRLEVKRRRSEVLGEHLGGMPGIEVRRLFLMGLPCWFFNMIWLAVRTFDASRDLVCFENFAGVGEILSAFARDGFASEGFDYSWDPNFMDFNSSQGFLLALLLTLRLVPEGCNWYATVCSTWVWMSRASTKRTIMAPMGRRTLAKVKQANAQVARMVLLTTLCLAKRCLWALEQPSSSIMDLSSSVRWLRGLPPKLVGGGWQRTYLHMGSYGAECRKPTYVYAIGDWCHTLMRTVDRHYVPSVVTATKKEVNGKKQITGTKSLKATQHYTKAFGMAVHASWKKHLRRKPLVANNFDEDVESGDEVIYGKTNWHGADCASLCRDLRIPSDRLVF